MPKRFTKKSKCKRYRKTQYRKTQYGGGLFGFGGPSCKDFDKLIEEYESYPTLQWSLKLAKKQCRFFEKEYENSKSASDKNDRNEFIKKWKDFLTIPGFNADDYNKERKRIYDEYRTKINELIELNTKGKEKYNTILTFYSVKDYASSPLKLITVNVRGKETLNKYINSVRTEIGDIIRTLNNSLMSLAPTHTFYPPNFDKDFGRFQSNEELEDYIKRYIEKYFNELNNMIPRLENVIEAMDYIKTEKYTLERSRWV